MCGAVDLALPGRIAESLDCLIQRLKSVELVAQGASWQVAQRLEVLPPERPVLSTRGGTKAVIKEQQDEAKTRNDSSKDRGKGTGWQGSFGRESARVRSLASQ